MSATPATRGVQRLGNLITIDYLDHCAALAQERDTLFLQTVILAEQRAVLAARGVKYTDAIPLAARLDIVARGKAAARELEGY